MWLPKGMVVEKGQRFTIREGQLTIGTGVVTNILPPLNNEQKLSISMSKKNLEKLEAKKSEKAVKK